MRLNNQAVNQKNKAQPQYNSIMRVLYERKKRKQVQIMKICRIYNTSE